MALSASEQAEMAQLQKEVAQATHAVTAPGLVEPGNINLNNRPQVRNDDGSVSTVRSIGANIDGKEVLLPTVSDNGRIMSNEEAIAEYRRAGQHLGVFDNPQSSDAYAQSLHQDQAAVYGDLIDSAAAKPAGGLSAQEQAEMQSLQKEVGHLAPTEPDWISSIKTSQKNVNDALPGLMNGKFRDTGRAANSPGEYLDSVVGAPVRSSLDSAVQGKGLISTIKAGASSVAKDPKNAPTGFDVASHMGVENPYLGSALATGIDVGAQLPIATGLNVGGKVASRGSQYLGNALKDIAETRAFKGLGPTKAFEDASQSKGLINSIGRTALDEGVISPLASKKTMLTRADALADTKSQELGGLLRDVLQNKNLSPEQSAQLEASKFVPSQAAEDLKGKIKSDYSELPPEIIDPRLKQVDSWLSSSEPKDIEQTQKFKTQMQKFIKDSSYYKDNPGASQDVLLGIRNAAKEGIEKNADAYAGLLGEEGGAVKSTNRQLGNALEMGNILDDRVSREGANRSLSLTDYISGLAGHGALGPKGLLLAPVNKFAREKGSQLMATGADSISKMLLESPTMRDLAEKDPGGFSSEVSRIARQMYLGKQSPKAAGNDQQKGFLNAQ